MGIKSKSTWLLDKNLRRVCHIHIVSHPFRLSLIKNSRSCSVLSAVKQFAHPVGIFHQFREMPGTEDYFPWHKNEAGSPDPDILPWKKHEAQNNSLPGPSDDPKATSCPARRTSIRTRRRLRIRSCPFSWDPDVRRKRPFFPEHNEKIFRIFLRIPYGSHLGKGSCK